MILFVLFAAVLAHMQCPENKPGVIAGLPHPRSRPTAVHISQSETLILLDFGNSHAGALPHKYLCVRSTSRVVLSFP